MSLNIAEMLEVKIKGDVDNEKKRLEIQERALKIREDQMRLMMANPHLLMQGGGPPAFQFQQQSRQSAGAVPNVNDQGQSGSSHGGLTELQPVQPFDQYMKFY